MIYPVRLPDMPEGPAMDMQGRAILPGSLAKNRRGIRFVDGFVGVDGRVLPAPEIRPPNAARGGRASPAKRRAR